MSVAMRCSEQQRKTDVLLTDIPCVQRLRPPSGQACRAVGRTAICRTLLSCRSAMMLLSRMPKPSEKLYRTVPLYSLCATFIVNAHHCWQIPQPYPEELERPRSPSHQRPPARNALQHTRAW